MSALSATTKPPLALETKRSASAVALTETGSFEGYASLFNLVDLGRDMLVPGAFGASLKTRGAKGVKLLWQHDPAQPIGAWVSIIEDNKGLKVRGQLNLAVARAREVYALMKDGAVDGLSIGFKAEKALVDPATGVRRLIKVDLWEISIVTFPMLPQARVANVKGAGMNARLVNAIERGALAMSVQTKGYAANAGADESRLAKAIHAGADILCGYMRPVDPDQARDAQDPGGETANDSDGDAQSNTPTIIPVQSDGSGRYFVDLVQEELKGGHSLEKHVGKSDNYLLYRVNTEVQTIGFVTVGLKVAGSFSSLQSANSLVNSTLSQNSVIVDAVAKGEFGNKPKAIEAYFNAPTGRQALRASDTSQAYMRDTYGVLVVLVYDPNLTNGFFVRTAYPINLD